LHISYTNPDRRRPHLNLIPYKAEIFHISTSSYMIHISSSGLYDRTLFVVYLAVLTPCSQPNQKENLYHANAFDRSWCIAIRSVLLLYLSLQHHFCLSLRSPSSQLIPVAPMTYHTSFGRPHPIDAHRQTLTSSSPSHFCRRWRYCLPPRSSPVLLVSHST